MYDDDTKFCTAKDGDETQATFGFSAVCEVRRGGGMLAGLTEATRERVEIRRKGTRASIERAARQVRGFIRVAELWEYSEDAYVRAFGWGKM